MKQIHYLLTTLWVLLLSYGAVQSVSAQDKEPGTIVLKTDLKVGEKFSLKISAYSDDEEFVLDGLQGPLQLDGKDYHSYIVTKQEITIKGRPSLFYCEKNKITSMKISNIEELGILNCNDNAIETLELTNLPNLIWLRAVGNKLKGLDLSSTPSLNRLYVYDNQISGKAMTDMIGSLPKRGSGAKENGFLFILNESAPTEHNLCLKSDVALANQRNWKVYKYLGNSNAYGIYTGEAVIEHPHIIMTTTKKVGDKLNLAIKGVDKLTIDGIKEPLIADGEMHTYTIQKQEIKISGNVQGIYCPDNELTRLDVENQNTLREVRCPNNKIKELKLENNKLLMGLECSRNELTKLNLLENYYLQGVDCAYNKIEDLDCYPHVSLIFLYCEYNALKRLNLGAAPKAIVKLRCGNNQLQELDLSKCPSIDGIECQNNQLKELPLNDNTMLIDLNVSGNKLSTLDLGKHSALTTLECQNNELTELILAPKNTLRSLVCFNNRIKAPNASKMIAALPVVEESARLVFITSGSKEQNEALTSDVEVAESKNWQVLEAILGEGEYTTKPYAGIAKGIDEAEALAKRFSLAPSPANGYVQVTNLRPYGQVSVYSMAGKLCLSAKADEDGRLQLNTTGLPEGTYVIESSGQVDKLLIVR